MNNGDGFLEEILLEMNVSDWIQVLSIFSTLLISVVSITIATKSLKLTKKSIEDANKPFISCYIEMVEVGHFQKYFIIQNYGKTPATILDVRFNKEITGLGRNGSLDSIKNSLIAPNQKFITAVNRLFIRFIAYRVEQFRVNERYKCSKKCSRSIYKKKIIIAITRQIGRKTTYLSFAVHNHI